MHLRRNRSSFRIRRIGRQFADLSRRFSFNGLRYGLLRLERVPRLPAVSVEKRGAGREKGAMLVSSSALSVAEVVIGVGSDGAGFNYDHALSVGRKELACGSQAFIATLLFDPSMSALPIIPKQNSVSVGLFTH